MTRYTPPRSPVTDSKASLSSVNGCGALRSVLELASDETGFALGDLTVLSAQVDPYRLDTPAGHRDGRWVAEQLRRALKRSAVKIHWRGLHYAIVSQGAVRKPNGEPYLNNDDNWTWLVNNAGKSARWLGYIPFEKIIDNRNAPPIIHRKASVTPGAFVSIGLNVKIPDAADLTPTPFAEGFDERQAFAFAIFGEKASLEDVLLPIARAKQADLYLPTGEISDTLIHRIAKDADDDGRPLVMFTVADCDPAGHQMTVSIGRKLQAFRDLLFPDLQFEVVPVALTVEQVRDLGLPSTPLKETEKRADRWRAAFGVEQTEIDALATLQPATLREIVERAFEPYFDDTLAARVEQAEVEWTEAAQQAVDAQVDPETLATLREEAAERLTQLQSAIDDINERCRLAAGDHFSLPVIDVPEPEIDEAVERQALVSLNDSWVEATRALKDRKQYGNGHD